MCVVALAVLTGREMLPCTFCFPSAELTNEQKDGVTAWRPAELVLLAADGKQKKKHQNKRTELLVESGAVEHRPRNEMRPGPPVSPRAQTRRSSSGLGHMQYC